eukprot:6163391-Lingulodinium_polyedra.AAC.1
MSYSSRRPQRTFVRQVFAEAPFGIRQSASQRHSPNVLIKLYILRATTSSAGECNASASFCMMRRAMSSPK